MMIRSLEIDDYMNGYLDLYKVFTNDISHNYEEFIIFYDNYIKSNKVIYIVENNNKQLIGTITLLLEQKPFHNFQYVVHIEDVVINQNYKNMVLVLK